jgi:hypothetical protein
MLYRKHRSAVPSSLFLSVAFLAFLQIAPSSARACKPGSNHPHTLDAQAQGTDSTPPGLPTVSVERIGRGKGPQRSGCGESGTSCDDLGTITLLVNATDDQTSAESMGYQVELASGSLPSGLDIPSAAVRTMGGRLYFYWIDGNTDDQEAVSFSLTIRAVDLAGNVGEPATIAISDPGSGSGCTVARRGPASGWHCTAVGILLLAFLLRRRTAWHLRR